MLKSLAQGVLGRNRERNRSATEGVGGLLDDVEFVRYLGGSITVPVRQADIDQARIWHDEIMRTGLRLRSSSNLIPDSNFVGYVGEILVTRFLTANGLNAIHRVWTDGRRGHPAEIKVGNMLIEVKTQSHPRATDFIFQKSQEVDGHYVMAVHWPINTYSAKIWGGMDRATALALPTKTYPPRTIETRFKPYQDLELSPFELLRLLRRTESTAA